MTRISDERLAEMREWGERDRIRWPVRSLVAEVDYHRAKDAELHRLADAVKDEKDRHGWLNLRRAVLDKCGPS